MTVSTLTVVPEATASGTAPAAESVFDPVPTTLWRRHRLLDLCCAAVPCFNWRPSRLVRLYLNVRAAEVEAAR